MQTFDTPAPITAVLDIPGGKVRFVAGDRADTVVTVLPLDASKGRDVKLAEETTVGYADGVLRIASTPRLRNQILGPTGSVDLTVELPAGSRVEAKAASADFASAGRLGAVVYHGAHGPVAIDEAAEVTINSSASDVSVSRLTGPGEITTSKGDIRVTEAVRGALVLSTQVGDITVGAAVGTTGSLDAGTHHGRIRNSLGGAADATDTLDIHATTATGDIDAHSN